MSKPEIQLGGIVPHRDPNTIQVEEDRYVLDPETGKPSGYIRRFRGFPLREIYDELARRLEAAESEDFYFEWITSGWKFTPAKIDEWPEHLIRVACYVTHGGSEGYVVHVELFYRPAHYSEQSDFLERQPLAVIKVLGSKNVAWAIARRCADLLDV